jgi:LacI family transcriptional regulator
MATIKDVTEHAKVSVTTVSYVLNKNRRVSPDLEKRVWEAVKAIKYQPNALARSLRSKQTKTLGLIVPDNSNSFLADITRYIENECFALGYSIILCNTEERLEKKQQYIETFLAQSGLGR